MYECVPDSLQEGRGLPAETQLTSVYGHSQCYVHTPVGEKQQHTEIQHTCTYVSWTRTATQTALLNPDILQTEVRFLDSRSAMCIYIKCVSFIRQTLLCMSCTLTCAYTCI